MSEYESVVTQLKQMDHEEHHALEGAARDSLGHVYRSVVRGQTKWLIQNHTDIHEIPLLEELHEDE